MNKKTAEKSFEKEFEKFIDRCELDWLKNPPSFLERIFFRRPRRYWNTENRKEIARLFFIKGVLFERNSKKASNPLK